MAEGGRWAAYTRRSIAKGDDDGTHGVQLDACRRKVRELGGSIVLEARDDESGLIATREEYQRILELARRRQLEGVVVYRYDRFGRDLGEAATRVRELERLGVAVISATEGADDIMRDLSFVLANEESRRLAARIYPRQLELARAGRMVTAPPFAYRLEIDPASPDPLRPRRRPVIYEPEAALYREICALFLEGLSYQALSQWLFSRGHRCTWNAVRARLANPIYAGILAWNRRRNSRLKGRAPRPAGEHVYVEGAAPAIIDMETHRAVQAEIGRRFRNHGRTGRAPFPLVGLVYCACGRRMYANRNTHGSSRPGERIGYLYRCSSKYGPDPCPHPQMPGPRLEWALAEAVRLSPTPEDLDAAIARARRASTIDDRAEAMRRQLAGRKAEQLKRRASALIDRLLDGTLTPEAYREKAAEIELERAAIAAPQPSPAPRAPDLHQLRAILESDLPLETLSAAERRRLFLSTVERGDWGGAGLALKWTPAMAMLKGEAGRTIAPPKRRRSGGYLAWFGV